MRLDDLRRSPNALAADYRRFRVEERWLLSGHSHQAWPDVARDGVLEAFDDAASRVDAKWERAFAKAERVRDGYRTLLGDPTGDIALGPSLHDLFVRLLSALPWREKRRIVATDGEFHSLRRQLARLEEEGLEIVRIPSADADTLAERLGTALSDSTLVVFVSAVLFRNARIVTGLAGLASACARRGVPLVVDAYHALGVMPFHLSDQGLESAYVGGGGYKYLQLGEGNCALRLPPGSDLRPAITGWFAEFDALTKASGGEVAWGSPASRLAAATYDPTSHYRAARVFDFFAARGLTPSFLREVSRHQVGLLARRFDELGLPEAAIRRDRSTPLDRTGGFLALESPRAGEIQKRLLARSVFTDSRNTILRLGPAPYLADAQIERAIEILGEVVRALSRD